MRYAALALLLTGCFARQMDSPLTVAARQGNVAQVRALLAVGADPNEPDGANDWPPLMHAVHKNQLDAAAALLDGGAKADGAAPNGYTPLMMAAAYDRREMVALLLTRGASPRAADEEGQTALDYALTGTADVDRFTLFGCNTETASLLQRVSPPPGAAARRWARVKGCA